MLICLKIPSENCSVRQLDWIYLTQNHWSSSKHLNIVGFNTVRVEVTLQILLRTETEYTERYWYCQKIHLLCSQWCGGKFKCLTEICFFFITYFKYIYNCALVPWGWFVRWQLHDCSLCKWTVSKKNLCPLNAPHCCELAPDCLTAWSCSPGETWYQQ